MAHVESVSSATAEARITVVATQINYVIRETTGSTILAEVLKKGLIEKRYIAAVRAIAFNANDLICAQIEMKIDWERHEINLRRHGQEVLIDKSKPEGEQLTWVIGDMVRWFNGYKQQFGLTTCWNLNYIPEIENDQVARDRVTKELGLVYQPNRVWATGMGPTPEVILANVPELVDEVSFTCSFNIG